MFTTGRTVYHFHTRTKTARAPQLQAAAPDAWVELSAADAARLGIAEGDRVRVESPRGAIEVPARISGIRPGVAFAPFHYGYWDLPEGASPEGAGRAANELTLSAWDPVSKQPLYKVAAVSVTRLGPGEGPSRAPTTGGAAPVDAATVPVTTGGTDAMADSHMEEA